MVVNKKDSKKEKGLKIIITVKLRKTIIIWGIQNII